jgi:hypothetical protein
MRGIQFFFETWLTVFWIETVIISKGVVNMRTHQFLFLFGFLLKGLWFLFSVSLFVDVCHNYPGWFPNHQGWYPEMKPFSDQLIRKVLVDWRPVRHQFCEILNPQGWHPLKEGSIHYYTYVKK